MSAPLVSLTQNPVQYSTFSFGGDDTQLGRSGLFGTVAEWDRNAKDDCFKAHFVFFVKKAFAFLDTIGIGKCALGYGGFMGKIKECDYYQTGLDRNKAAREKIVAAFGGESACQAIPIVKLNDRDFQDYMKLGDAYLASGQWGAQGEDHAGRKFALLRVADRAGRVHTATLHQRYRETCIHPGFGDGSLWTLNLRNDSVQPNTDRTAEFVEKVRTGRHPEYSIAPKP